MQSKNIIIKLLSIFVTTFLLLSSTAFASPANAVDNGKKIRVFYPIQFGFAQQDDGGSYSGYNYEYLMKISQLTGWRYEFITFDASNQNLINGLEMVKNGEIELLGTMVYSDSAAEEYLYSSVPYGETNFILINETNNTMINERTLFDIPYLKVALQQKATMQNKLFDNYCKEKGINYQPIYAKTYNESKSLVKNGQADVLISKDVTYDKDFKKVITFATQPYYFATAKENTELMDELNKILTTINITDSSFQSNLHDKYFTTPSDYNISLTADEIDYVNSAPIIRVVVPINHAPLQDYNPKSKSFHGIVIDLLEQISVKSNLTFELIPADSISDANEIIAAGNADIIAGVSFYYASKDYLDTDLLFTSPILTAPIVRLSNFTDKAKTSEILTDSFIIFNKRDEIKFVDDIEQIFTLIETGKYEDAYVNGYTAQYYIKQNYFKNVILTPTPYDKYEICLGVVRSHDLRLISILEQAIATLMPSEIEDIVYQNTTYAQHAGIFEIIRRNPTQFVTPIIIILIIIAALLLSLFFKSRRINKLLSAEKNKYKAIAQTDRLTHTFNNESFKQLGKEYLTKIDSTPNGALIVCDIDNFKAINDNYGHLMGDEILSKFGSLLLKIFRDVDVVGRLGGDEFGVLIKDVSDITIIEQRCEELIQKSQNLSKDFETTLSIGVVIFSDKIPFNELYQKADTALYDVKSKGKNSYKILPY